MRWLAIPRFWTYCSASAVLVRPDLCGIARPAPIPLKPCGSSPCVPRIPTTRLGAERPKEGTYVRGQRLRLLQGREVAPAGHRRPALDVQDLLGHGAWGPHDLTRKGEIGGRHVDARAGGDGPVAVPGGVVGPEGGVDGASGPVEHHGCQQLVLGKAPLDLPTAVAPTPELLDDPGGQANGGVGQTVRERLGFGPLDPLVSCLFREPVLQLLEVVPLLVR